MFGFRELTHATAATALFVGVATSATIADQPTGAEVYPPGQTIQFGPILTAMSDWLEAEFGLPAPDQLPSVVLMPRDQLLTPRGGPAQATVETRARPAAAYDPARREIRLPLGWTGATPRGMSLLAHEMVHHLQVAAGVSFACPEEREALAYAAQDVWLRAHGGSLERDFGLNPLFLLFATTCVH